jgi:hypothetical protein
MDFLEEQERFGKRKTQRRKERKKRFLLIGITITKIVLFNVRTKLEKIDSGQKK